ncbi:hypothetical protein KZO85_03005 [Chromohalobacter canadensis]|uniref:hypothetical protein n=1 Tax=Chromohalobacter canadensis TaxID=141389 RepID=UPI0021BEF592|nr:hypothetical protein [Chromohalobacter canadensis]MCT8467540.1 hypothetical protein [Chromohalobacter canadensis]MCT8470712.1 hypothetical protein [Chromohalobacter canadensis]MCT8498037.1 hypothetical protein [Chromohalobacter canadensis]
MYLLDSDAAKKICQYCLLDELASSLSCSLNDFSVLPQLRYQLKINNPKKSLEKLGSQGALNEVSKLITHSSEVKISQDSANLLLKLDQPDIDSGEATLFAATHETGGSLLSGDKRAFIAISKIDGSTILDTLWVRFICFDEAILLLVNNHCFNEVSSKIRSRPDVDTAISIAFGRSTPNDRDGTLAALTSYIGNLIADTYGKYHFK